MNSLLVLFLSPAWLWGRGLNSYPISFSNGGVILYSSLAKLDCKAPNHLLMLQEGTHEIAIRRAAGSDSRGKPVSPGEGSMGLNYPELRMATLKNILN